MDEFLSFVIGLLIESSERNRSDWGSPDSQQHDMHLQLVVFRIVRFSAMLGGLSCAVNCVMTLKINFTSLLYAAGTVSDVFIFFFVGHAARETTAENSIKEKERLVNPVITDNPKFDSAFNSD